MSNSLEETMDVPETENLMDIENDPLELLFESIEEQETLDKTAAIDKYLTLLKDPRNDEIANRVKENVFYKLGTLYTEQKAFNEVVSLLKTNNDFFGVIPKAKTAKIVRKIIEMVAKVPDSLQIQIQLCRDVVDWCKIEKRTFLRQRIEAKLANLLLLQKEPQNALVLITTLLSELKKLDDKQMLTEVHLTESKIHHALRNIPKAKAALTASRSAAHAIYVTPNLQGELDEMSGILHCEEGDYVTAYSYFLEAHEGFDQSNDTRSLTCLQYLILCKVLNDAAHEVPAFLSSKIAMKYSGIVVESMQAIAHAAMEKSLDKFQQATMKYQDYFQADNLISHNLNKLYEKMLEGNLLKIIHPYSVVEISYVAEKINLPIEKVERKLSQMILDHRFEGILNQGKGELIIYDSTHESTSYTRGLEIIGNMGSVVDVLTTRASKPL